MPLCRLTSLYASLQFLCQVPSQNCISGGESLVLDPDEALGFQPSSCQGARDLGPQASSWDRSTSSRELPPYLLAYIPVPSSNLATSLPNPLSKPQPKN